MKFNLILDLEEQYIKENQKVINEFAVSHNVMNSGNVRMKGRENVLVFTDSKSNITKWDGYAVIGIEHGKRIGGIPYVVEEIEDVDEAYMNLVYHRKHQIPMTIMETENLILREMQEADANDLCGLYEDKGAVRYIAPIHEVSEEKEYIKAYVKNMYGFYGYGMWSVVRKSDNRLIGRAGIEHRTLDGVVFCELGYFIGAKYQQMGYGYEAAKAVLEVAPRLGVKELVAYIHEKNTPSVKLVQKLGFSFWKSLWDGENFLIYKMKSFLE